MAGLAIQPAPLAGTGQRFASAPSSVLGQNVHPAANGSGPPFLSLGGSYQYYVVQPGNGPAHPTSPDLTNLVKSYQFCLYQSTG